MVKRLNADQFTSKSAFEAAKKHALTPKLLGKPSGKRLGQWTLKDVRQAAAKLEEKNAEGENQEDQISPSLVDNASIKVSDDQNFSRRDFSSTTAFQLACDNQHVIRVKDMTGHFDYPVDPSIV